MELHLKECKWHFQENVAREGVEATEELTVRS